MQCDISAPVGDTQRVPAAAPQQLIILPTMYDRRLKEHEYNYRLLLDEQGQRVAQPVPARVAVAETHAVGKTIWEHESAGLAEVRTAYAQLIEWLTTPTEEGERCPAKV